MQELAHSKAIGINQLLLANFDQSAEGGDARPRSMHEISNDIVDDDVDTTAASSGHKAVDERVIAKVEDVLNGHNQLVG